MFHVHLMNVVDQGTEGVGVLGNIVIHAHQTGVNVQLVNLDINSTQQGHVDHVD